LANSTACPGTGKGFRKFRQPSRPEGHPLDGARRCFWALGTFAPGSAAIAPPPYPSAQRVSPANHRPPARQIALTSNPPSSLASCRNLLNWASESFVFKAESSIHFEGPLGVMNSVVDEPKTVLDFAASEVT
jgi:hypothetical protein